MAATLISEKIEKSTDHVAHSADVEMRLYVGEQALQIAQLGPDFLVLQTPMDLKPQDAEIFLRIDHTQKRWKVALVEGAKAGEDVVPIKAVPV